MKRPRHSQDVSASEEWVVGVASEGENTPSAMGSATTMASTLRVSRRGVRESVETRVQAYPSRSSSNPAIVPVAAIRETKKAATVVPAPADKMGGLPLPDVVRELLKEKNILRWDAKEGVYEVLHGDNFERRFNELRKVRSKVKAAGTERPFSRMYNFYVLEKGDKWARTGTRFRPRTASSQPTPEILAAVRALEAKRSSLATLVTGNSARSPSSRQSSSGVSSTASSPRVSLAPQKLPSPSSSSLPSPIATATPTHTSAMRSEADQQRRSRDTSFRIEPVARAPPPAPRHQPIPSPSMKNPEMKLLGKRSYKYLLEDDATVSPRDSPRDLVDRVPLSPNPNATLDKSMLSEQLARAIREVSSNHITSLHSASAERKSFEHIPLSPGPYQHEFQDYSRDANSLHAPIEIDDASSGFPSPECMLALNGEFSGSPLDLGDAELSLFGTDAVEHHCATLVSKDHALLIDPVEVDEPWMSLHSVMW